VGTHIPEVVEYVEEKGWETDFYMCCLYNLAPQPKPAPIVDPNAYQRDEFLPEDPPRMTAVMRKVSKPCIAFKIVAAGRHCATRRTTEDAFRYAFDNIKPTDMIDVGMFQKHKNQVEENADIVRHVLGRPPL
jgi:hypothetical protein